MIALDVSVIAAMQTGYIGQEGARCCGDYLVSQAG